MKKAYYARPINLYNTEYQYSDTDAINKLGFKVIDITSPIMQDKYKLVGMDAFKEIIKDCDALFFRAQFDGRIGAGVAKEIGCAREYGIPVFEIPNSIRERTATVTETRNYLKEWKV